MKAFHEHRMYRSPLPFQAFSSTNIHFLAHWHNDVELVFVRDGQIRMGVNSEARTLRQGDLVVCGSGDIHYYDSREHDSTIMILIFNPQLIGCPAGWPKDAGLASPFIGRACSNETGPEGEALNKIASLMHHLQREAEEKQPRYEMLVTGMLYELCGWVQRLSDRAPEERQRDKRGMLNRKVMQQVFDYLEAHFAQNITLEDAAGQASMSMYHFSRYFKSISGMSFLSYLNSIRVQKAEEQLTGTDKTILDIALECGFTNVRTFNRVFKQVRGCTPSSLR